MEDKSRLTNSESGGEKKVPFEKAPPLRPFNADLAMRVAEDTQKLTQGKLSEPDYYHKYHDAYVKEFGIDARPVLSSDTIGKASSDSILTGHMSRRTLLKLGGVALASAAGARLLGGRALGAAANLGGNSSGFPLKENGEQAEGAKRVQMGMVIDLENCDGCLSCVYACSNHNFNSAGVLWLYILAFKDENREGNNFLVRICQHCANPPCVKVCPVRARHKRDKDGLVLTDYNLCIGCRYCMVTCPYGVNYFQWGEPERANYYHPKLTDYRGRWVIGNPPKGVMGKCTFCPDRQDDGRGNVVCALTCPHNVLHFGDINDPNSEPMRYLAAKQKEKGGNLSTFRLLENQGTKPSIIYIGHQPTRSAKAVDGPVSYADWGLVEKRLDVLQGPKPWFSKAFGGTQ
ncbi:MAG: 4Fe-4S dicluster domain-containing protein [Chloroflexi bacterium]|nr:4Fe-4S dicluster domain-containing protein [Chloroflexota bacterium]